MIPPIQAVSNAGSASVFPVPDPISRLTRAANSLLFVPSVILTLGATSPAPITYDAAGLFESLVQLTGTAANAATATPALAANTATAVTASAAEAVTAPLATDADRTSSASTVSLATQPTLAGQAMIDAYAAAAAAANETAVAAGYSDSRAMLLALLAKRTLESTISVLPTDTAFASAVLPAASGTAATTPAANSTSQPVTGTAIATATPATTITTTVGSFIPAATTSVPETAAASAAETTLPTATDTASSASWVASAVSDNFLQDTVAQVLANIGSNPAYASAVAGFFMDAIVLHATQASAEVPSSATERLAPITAVQVVGAVTPER